MGRVDIVQCNIIVNLLYDRILNVEHDRNIFAVSWALGAFTLGAKSGPGILSLTCWSSSTWNR